MPLENRLIEYLVVLIRTIQIVKFTALMIKQYLWLVSKNELNILLFCEVFLYNVVLLQVAEAGFYHIGGPEDTTMCVVCQKELEGWEEGDSPRLVL